VADSTAARAANPPAEITGTSFCEISFHFDIHNHPFSTKPDDPAPPDRRGSDKALTTPIIVVIKRFGPAWTRSALRTDQSSWSASHVSCWAALVDLDVTKSSSSMLVLRKVTQG
jgi:hypothetical protein